MDSGEERVLRASRTLGFVPHPHLNIFDRTLRGSASLREF
jgi:hypothetical protein